MAWGSKIAATQLTSITTEQVFDRAPTLAPRESAHCRVAVDFPASPTDDAVISVYGSLDGTAWSATPLMALVLDKDVDPNSIDFIVTGVYADGNPIVFEANEPYTIALLILWTEAPGNEGIFRSGSANTGSWLWMLSGGKLWGRHANVNSPASGSGPLITAGWHTLVRVWDGHEVRQYVDGLRTNTTAVTATGSWPLYRFGFQFTGAEMLDEAYVPFFGAFGAAWDDAMVARWSANPLGMMWPERDVALVGAGGGGDPPAMTRRPVVVIVTA